MFSLDETAPDGRENFQSRRSAATARIETRSSSRFASVPTDGEFHLSEVAVFDSLEASAGMREASRSIREAVRSRGESLEIRPRWRRVKLRRTDARDERVGRASFRDIRHDVAEALEVDATRGRLRIAGHRPELRERAIAPKLLVSRSVNSLDM